jgi:hypothetical protein
MRDFLVSHELDQVAILGIQPGALEFLSGELGETMMEAVGKSEYIFFSADKLNLGVGVTEY